MSEFPHASFRIELGSGKRLGPGKVRLLELIASHGSISAAAREMGMSYRRAWLLVEQSNQLFAGQLVESAAGGAGGGGARLTGLGHQAVRLYRDIERQIAEVVQSRLAAAPELITDPGGAKPL
jgi:molybdate transport system regulatory protein